MKDANEKVKTETESISKISKAHELLKVAYRQYELDLREYWNKNNDLTELNQELTTRISKLTTSEKNLVDSEAKLRKCESEKGNLKLASTHCSEEKTKLTGQNTKLSSDLEALKALNLDLNTEIRTLSKQGSKVLELTQQLDECRKEIRFSSDNLNILKEKVSRAEAGLSAEITKGKKALSNAEDNCEKDIRSMENQINSL